MADTVQPVQYAQGSVNNVPDYQLVTSGNIPNGYNSISQQDFVGGLQNQINSGQLNGPNLSSYQNMLSQAKAGTNPNPMIASFTNTVTGQAQTNVPQATMNAEQAQQQAIASGAQKQIAPGLSVPVGSPSALLQSNPGAYAAQYGGQGVPGFNPPGTPQSTVNTQQYADAHAAATSAGATAPTNAEGATSLYNNYLSSASTASQAIAQDPYLNQMQQAYNTYMNNQNQQQSLAQTYQSLLQSSGLQDMNTQAINMQNVINGTEDDIRNEVTKSGGFATNSQVMALTDARNKQLIQNYNTLEQTIQNTQSYINTTMNLTEQDRQDAQSQFTNQMNFDQQMEQIQEKMQSSAVDTLTRVSQTIGWDGVYQATQGNPQLVSQIEQTYGLPAGSLAIAAQQATAAKTLQAQQQAQTQAQAAAQLKLTGAQTQEAYANTAKTTAETGALGTTNPIQEAVDEQNAKQNAADAQTVNSNYQTIIAIADKVGKTPDTLTANDIKNLSNADQTSIGKALGRMQMPDVARAGGNTTNPLDSVGLIQGIGQQFTQLTTGKLYDPSKVLDAVKTATSLYNQRQATGLSSTTQGQGSSNNIFNSSPYNQSNSISVGNQTYTLPH